MVKIRIEYNRKNCIGAFACMAIDPERWVSGNDGKADLVNGKAIGAGEEDQWVLEFEANENELSAIVSAAQACPVSVIKIKDLDNDKELA